jgi:4-oxalocrotonate tautomerase
MASHLQRFPLRSALGNAKEDAMPYVNIKITKEGATPAQKAEVIAGVTEVLVRVLGKDPASTFIVIDEVELGDWGVGGMTVAAYRKHLAEGN